MLPRGCSSTGGSVPAGCVLLARSLPQHRARQGSEMQPKELGKYLGLSTHRAASHSGRAARSARTGPLSQSPLSHCSHCGVGEPH